MIPPKPSPFHDKPGDAHPVRDDGDGAGLIDIDRPRAHANVAAFDPDASPAKA